MGFKRCPSCMKTSFPTVDPHEVCFACLGTEHQTESCILCLKMEPKIQRSRFLRTQLWVKRSEKDGLVSFPPKADMSLTQTKTELLELGVTPEEIKFQTKLSRYRKTESELTDSDMEIPDEIPGDTPDSFAKSQLVVGSGGRQTLHSATRLRGSRGESDRLPLIGSGDSVPVPYGGSDEHSDSGQCQGFSGINAGSRFGRFKTLVQPNLDALGGARRAAGTISDDQGNLRGTLGQLTEMVSGVITRLDGLESRRGPEMGLDSRAPWQAPTPDTGGLEETRPKKKRARLADAIDYARSEYSQEEMAPEEVTQAYSTFLTHMSVEAGFADLVIIEKQPESLALSFSGKQRPAVVTLALNEESSAVLQRAMKAPRFTQQPAKSIFKVPRTTYTKLCVAPALDDEIKFSVDTAKRSGPPKATVLKWGHALNSSYEAHMASFRMAHHNSLMATFVDQLATKYDDDELADLSRYQMHLSHDMLTSSASGAASIIHAKRAMMLSLTDELATGVIHDKVMTLPFQGEQLFGPDFMTVIAKTSESQQKLTLLKQQLTSLKQQTSRGQAPYRGRGRGVQRGRGVPAYRGGRQQSATITSAAQADAYAFPQQPFRGAGRGRGGRGAPRGGGQRGARRGRIAYKPHPGPAQ